MARAPSRGALKRRPARADHQSTMLPHRLFPRRRAGRVGAVLLGAVLACAVGAPAAHGFGSVWGLLDQRSEHERVTRAALGCVGNVRPPECFQEVSLDNLAGKRGTWGAVAAPDNLLLHLNYDAEYWHCDNADWLDQRLHGLPSPYPQSRHTALNRLRDCLAWGRDKLYDGGVKGKWPNPPATPDTGAVAAAADLIKRDGRVDASNPGVGLLSPTCTYNGTRGRAKCNVLEPFGYVLHMAQDFYAHTNWADRADPSRPLSLTNPIGLGRRDLAPFLDLRQPLPSDDAVPEHFSGGCYPKKDCAGRVIHGESASDLGLNKDKVLIDVASGATSDPKTPRGALVVDGVTNADRAVASAVAETQRQWRILRAELAQRYGTERAAKMACALTLDHSEQCDQRTLVVAVDTTARTVVTGATARAAAPLFKLAVGRRVIDRLDRDDRVAVVAFDRASGHVAADGFAHPAKARIRDARAGGRRAQAARGAARRATPARALRRARGLLGGARAHRHQQGVVLVTRRLGHVGALVREIDALRRAGAVVSLAVLRGSPVPVAVVRAVERTGGVVVASRSLAELRRFAAVADGAGLTRLGDLFAGRAAPLRVGDAPLHGVTDRGADRHDVEALRGDATATLRSFGRPLTLAVLDAATGRVVRRRTAARGVATVRLAGGGNYEVEVEGPAGQAYELAVRR